MDNAGLAAALARPSLTVIVDDYAVGHRPGCLGGCGGACQARMGWARVRYWVGALDSILIAFLTATLAHEGTHLLQAWRVTGEFHFDMELNPLFRADVCGGHFSCAGAGIPTHAFWLGEGLAYLVTVLVLVPLYLWLLPKLTGVPRP